MLTPRSALIRHVAAVVDTSPSRIPVLLGPSGSGRTTLLHQLRERIGRSAVQYVDVERMATTPERLLQGVAAASPFPAGEIAVTGARASFEATVAFFNRARPAGTEPATFLLDEFLEFRTFESFPGLRRVLQELIDGLALSGNRFVLTSRYTHRALRLFRDKSARFEVIHMPQMSAEDTMDLLGPAVGRPGDGHDREYMARTIQALADGRPSYIHSLAEELRVMRDQPGARGADAVSAL